MRRTWKLLLAVLVLTMILAVPAMAATHTAHEDGQTWYALSADTEFEDGGYYYLEGALEASLTVSARNVTICLNGQTWSGVNARPLTITGGSVTVCDCCYVAPTVDASGALGTAAGGKIQGYDYGGNSVGGAVSVASGASFTLESGTITGGRAKNGGNICSKGSVTVAGGLVSDGECGIYDNTTNIYSTRGWGGNIYFTDTLTVSGGIISGGVSGGNGGNVYNDKGTLNMTGGLITGGDSRDNGGNIFTTGNMSLTGGTVTLGTAKSGGNISANAGGKTVVLTGVNITNGTSCGTDKANSSGMNSNGGANVRFFNAAPASVTIGDGTVITGGQSSATNGSQNVYIGKENTIVNIGSAVIDGNVHIVDGCVVNLSGAPNISGAAINLCIGTSTLTAANMTGGSVGITATGDARAFSASGVSDYAGYFSADSGSALGVAYNSSDTKMWLCAKYCVCGASKNGGDHNQGCDKESYAWLPYNTGSGLPGDGNWYLTQAVTVSSQKALTANGTLRLDLNNQTVTRNSARMITTAAINGSGSVTLWITDTSSGGNGTLKATGTDYTGQGMVVWLNSTSTLYLIAGKLDAFEATTSNNGAAVVVQGTSNFYMYGGTVLGGTASKGGAVRVDSGSTFHMYGGTVSDGKAASEGGAVSIAGTMNLYGGSISGGKLSDDTTSNLYVTANGTLNVYPLAEKSAIGISAEEAGVFAGVTDAVTLADKACFTSDDSAYIVALTANGLELVEKDAHVHCSCNGTVGTAANDYTHSSGHVCREVVYTAADDVSDLASGGSFYLTGDITGAATPTADLDLCLCGKTWTSDGTQRPLNVSSGITVNIADCADEAGSIVGYSHDTTGGTTYYGGTVELKGVLNLFGGTLVGGKATQGGTLFLNASGATFRMYGGTVSGGEATGNGGSIRMYSADACLYMYGGLITGGKTGDQGGNIFCGGYMYLYGGSVTDGEALAKNGGGNIAINSKRAVELKGVTVTGGKAATEGGNIRISSTQSAGSLTIGAGTYISGGQAKNGGNIYVSNNNTNATTGSTCKATLSITGGTIENGVVTDNSATANIYAVRSEKTGVTTAVNLKLSGGTVKGGVYAKDGTTVTLSGAPVIDGGDDCRSNLELCSNTLAVNADLSASARVFISCANAANGTVVAENITDGTDVSGIYYQGSQYALYYDAVAGTLALGEPGAALVNGDLSTVYPTLQAAIAAAGSGDYVRLVADYTGDALEIGTLYLDLNGFDITSDITVTGTLYLFDSKTADYSVKNGEELTGFGTVTGTVTGNVARAFTTSAIKANYENHNYRYMVVKVDGAYSSHRIYLAVKSTILYPQTPALNYRTVLRCNEYFAQLINEKGGYGVLLESYKYDASAENYQGALSYTYGDYVENGKTVLAYCEENGVITQENDRITRFDNILDSADKNSTENQYRAAANVKARAYIWIGDELNTAESKTGAAIYENGVLSSGVNYSLKDMILAVNSDSRWATLTEAQKTALGGMYGQWEALMKSWDLHNIATMKSTTVKYGCLCGDPDSTDNPCAEEGHIEFAWKPWTDSNSLPTASGNWYLTGTITLSSQTSIKEKDSNTGEQIIVNLNTCGYSITSSSDRVGLVYGVLNLTNYSFTGLTVDESVVTGAGRLSNNADAQGGAFLIMESGNMSIYDNVTVQAADEHTISYGVIYTGGSLNIYGGKVVGTDPSSGKGGAVYVSGTGRMFMNSGSVQGGTATQGGAIYAAGDVVVAGGTVSGGNADDGENVGYGGNIYVASGGSFSLTGGAVKDGDANKTSNTGYGGNIYIADGGTVSLAGGTVSGGEAGDFENGEVKGHAGNVYVAAGGTLKISTGAQISGGTAPNNGGSIHVADGATFEMTGGQISGGQTKDQGGNLFLNENATITGGTITTGQAKNGGNLALGNSDNGVSLVLRGVTISGGTATYEGGNIRVQNNAKIADTNLTIETGTTVSNGHANTYGGNISAYCDLTVTGGEISGGTAYLAGKDNKGGNIFVSNAGTLDVTLEVSGGTVTGGEASSKERTDGYGGYGGNIYAQCTTVTLSGGTVSDGYAYCAENANKAWGGNLYVSSACNKLTIESGVTVSGGCSGYNGGSIHMLGKSFDMSGGKVTGGQAVNAAGNIYISGDTTADISGGEISDGTADSASTNNIFVVGGTLNLSGDPIISGGVNVFAYNCSAGLSLSESPTVTGSGILLSHSANSSDTSGDGYHDLNVTLDLASLQSGSGSVVLRYTNFTGDHADGLLLASATSGWTGHPYERVARVVLQDYVDSDACEISYETGGIYIRKSTGKSQKWTCKCGAHYGETHTTITEASGDSVTCDHFDVKYSPWTKNYLPNEPGYWYMTGRTITKNAAGVEYVEGLSQVTICYDYYVDSDGGYQKVRTVRALSTAGSTMSDSEGKPVSVADYITRYASTGGVPSYASTVGASTTAQSVCWVNDNNETFEKGDITPLTEYSIHVDLNGYKLEVGTGGRAITYNVFATKEIDGVTYNCYRDAEVTMNILDSSAGHTGTLATYGVYSKVKADGTQTAYSNGGTHYQGKLIWMPHSWDALNTNYVTLDASSTITGTGLVVYNGGGKVTMNYSTAIGGTAQGFYRADNGKLANTDITGGGAIAIFSGGTVTINGGTVRDGKSIYRNMLYNIDDNLYTSTGRTYEQAIGGGNIFVKDGTLNLNDATVTGGWSLICEGTDVAYQPSYSYSSGGGIYVLTGDVNISGNTVVNGNYCGTITSTLLTDTSGSANNFYGAVDVLNATITKTAKNDLFMGGNSLHLDNLTGEVHFRIQGFAGDYGKGSGTNARYNLSAANYIGTFATYTGTAPTHKTLICDDGSEPDAGFTVANGKCYYPWSETVNGVTYSGDSAYAVGYSRVCIQPNLEDLQGGFNMTNYGGNRWTNELYASTGSLYSSYYDIISDSSGYFDAKIDASIDGWDTKAYATALATTDGEGDTVIILALDAQTHSDDVAQKVKRMVSYATGVPQDNISLSSAHQHSIPGPTVRYKTYTGTDGKTYNELDSSGKAVVLADYSTEFYSGIVAAAVKAMADRTQATVQVGTLETTAEGKQYNFVRNVKMYSGTTFLGMVTDNHHDLKKIDGVWTVAGTKKTYADSAVTVEYESEMDTTMQLVCYHQIGDNWDVVMANFQTHPHRGSGSASYYVQSDVVGAFRHFLQEYMKKSGRNCAALYFSGGSGNVNATSYSTSASPHTNRYPENVDGITPISSTDVLQKLEKACYWGESLAVMATNFLNGTTYSGSTAMKTVSGSNNVEVVVEDYACTVKSPDATETAIKNATNIRKWSDGEYVNGFVSFTNDVWMTYVGEYTNPEDRVYSSFDSTNIRRSYLWEEAGYEYQYLNLTAYAMGEIGFVAAPYEMFQENGSQIKAGATDYAMTIVATLANGSNSYIPSAEGFKNGGYSTDQSRFEAGTGEELANKFVSMLNGLK